MAIHQIVGQSTTITIAKGFAILHNPTGSHTINEDYGRIVSVDVIPMQSRAMPQWKEKSVFRYGLTNMWGNPPQSRLRRVLQSYTIRTIPTQSMKITGGLCLYVVPISMQSNVAIEGEICVQTWIDPLRSVHNQNSKNHMFLCFAIRPQSNFIFCNPFRLWQDCKMLLEI